MATFTYTPSFPASEISKPRVRRVALGDGYEQRVRFGLNTDMKEWRLTFDNRTDAQRDEILAFFEARGGWDAFTWTTPHGDLGQFVCDEWQSQLNSCNFNTITATFRQVPEPQ